MHALVAVDLESDEQELYEEVLERLDRIGATVALVYVDVCRPSADLATGVGEALTARERAQQRRLEALLVRFPLDRRGRIYLLERREAAEAIVDLAPGQDLIVVGTHGRRGVARLWLGSVAERVIRSSPIPVLVVRRPLPGSPPEGPRMLVAVDLEAGAEALAAQTARWALAFRARVDALYVARRGTLADAEMLASGAGVASHVVEAADRAWLARLEEWMGRLPVELRGEAKVVEHAEVATGILTASPGYQLLAIGTRGLRGPARLWLAPVAERVARLADIPVLVAPLGDG